MTPDPVGDYARAVLSGEIVAGRLVRLACARHLRDLEAVPARGLTWDPDAALRAIRFFSHLQLPEGGGPFVLQPWQAFIVGSIHGWKGPDGYRRFRIAYIEIGKGNGKTPLAAGEGLYGLVADGEDGAQIYSAATTQDQAKLVFRDGKLMAEASPNLAKRLNIGLHNIAYPKTNSFFRPVSGEHRGLDGKRVHMGLIDELHEHPTSMVMDKIRAGTKGRKQALIFSITNSGHDRTSVCWAHHEYSVRVLEGEENDSWFAYVCQLDPCEACRLEGKTFPTDGCPDCDQWTDETCWLKANPNLGVSVTLKYLREQVAEALGMPTKVNIVKRLNMCIWTQVSVHAIPMDKWDACRKGDPGGSAPEGECFGGLDIGAVSDFTALARLFPHADAQTVEVPVDPQQPDGEKRSVTRRSYTWRSTFWLPERRVRRDKRMEGIIDTWIRQGIVIVTPGDVVDYDQVLEDIKALDAKNVFRELAFDRGFQGASMGTNLLKHFGDTVIVAFPQGILSMAPPFRELIELIIQGRIHHDGCPVTRWMMANCAAEVRGGLSKPSKDASREKIDIVTGGVMALGRAMLRPDDGTWFEPGMWSR